MYNKILNSELGKEGLDYLLSRGFTPELLNKHLIGFSPNHLTKQFVYEEFAKSKKFDPVELLVARILTIQLETGNVIDYFNSPRVVFPIFHHGKVVGFSARSTSSIEPKYKTMKYDKMGIFNIDTLSYNPERVYLCEGAIDCLSLCQMGFPSIGILGLSSIGKEHADFFKDYKGEVVMVFDNEENESGSKGIERVARVLYSMGMTRIGFKELPRNEESKVDLNSFMIEHGIHVSRFKFAKMPIHWLNHIPLDIIKDRGKYTSMNDEYNIIDVVSRYASDLKQEGSSKWRCLCPFPDHNDNYPSFIVNSDSDKNWYKCYGCGRYGGPIRFLMTYYGLEARDAIRKHKGMM